MTLLVVAAHPDDEVLGAGGTLAALTERGKKARVCILSACADARTRRPRSQGLNEDMLRASEILGLEEPILGDFPNIKLNTIPHLELVQFIENAIRNSKSTTIITHHPRDLNDDHKLVSSACQAASRLFQRSDEVTQLRALYFMEILSSSDWSFPGTGTAIDPDTFFEIGTKGLELKIQALNAYRGVMRPYPHPRSREVITALATCRGAQSRLMYAEGFQTAFRILQAGDVQ